MATKNENVKVYGGLELRPYFEDREFLYYPMANGAVWCESKHDSCGWSATKASNESSSVRNKTLDRWFNLAD